MINQVDLLNAIDSVSLKQIGLALGEVLSSIYGDRISEVVGLPRLNGDMITGYFRDDDRFYSYELGKDFASYVEAKPRRDSYLQGFYLGDIAEYLPQDKLGSLTYTFAQQRGDARRKRKKSRCPNSTPCGDACIPRDHKCRQNLSLRQQKVVGEIRNVLRSTPEITKTPSSSFTWPSKKQMAMGIAGVAGLVVAGPAAYVAVKINRGKLSEKELSIVDQDEADRLQRDLNKPEINEGITGYAAFVSDSETGREYVFKEARNGIFPFFMGASAEATASDIGQNAGVKVNKVKLVPKDVDFFAKMGEGGASLHALVPGVPTAKLPEGHPYKELDNIALSIFALDNRDDLPEDHKDFVRMQLELQGVKPPTTKDYIDAIASHPDLAKIAALDVFTGNADRHSSNLFYDDSTDSFWGIDMGLSFAQDDGPTRAVLKEFSNLDFSSLSPQQVQGLQNYLDTLKILQQDNPPNEVMKRWSSYVSQEGGDANVLRRLSAAESIDRNYKATQELIDLLESQLKQRRGDDYLSVYHRHRSPQFLTRK